MIKITRKPIIAANLTAKDRMNRKDIVDIEQKYGLKASKLLGQNFLINGDVIQRIIDSLCLTPDSRVLEIGPGLGALTGEIALRSGSLTAVEIDSGFASFLRERFAGNGNVTLIHGDFLKTDLPDSFDIIVSNLPYYCASEIIFRIAGRYSCRHCYFMVQKELAERMVSKPGHKNYGALTLNMKLYFDARILFNIGSSSFYPRPDVNSSFIKLERVEEFLSKGEKEMFHILVKSLFWGRRKKLSRALTDSPHADFSRERVDEILFLSGIDGNLRGEMLGFDDLCAMVRAATKV